MTRTQSSARPVARDLARDASVRRLAAALRDHDQVRAERARRDFNYFRRFVDPHLVDGWWHRDAGEHLQQFYEDLRAGRRPKLAIFAPPQHGKSRIVGDFVAWVLGRWPDCRIIYTSFSHDLGVQANRTLQKLMDGEEYLRAFPESALGGEAVVTQFNKPRRNQRQLDVARHRGYFQNVTTGGQITGKTQDLGLGDDLMKGDQAALSPVQKEAIWGWYLREFMARFDQGGGQVQIGTRWSLDDPLGRMVRNLTNLQVLSYPAIATRDEAHRREGEALFPEFKDLDFLLERKALFSPSQWASLYQQDPIPEGGAIVKEAWLAHRYRARGAKPHLVVQSWDCASKPDQRNDPSACGTFAVFADRVELWDVSVQRQEFPDLLRRAKDLYAADWGVRPHAVLIEDKDAGQQLAQTLRRETTLPVVAIDPGRLDKTTRLDAAAPFLQAGNLQLPESAPWVRAYVEELTTFPSGIHDDQVDLTSQFVAWYLARRGRDGATPVSLTRAAPRPD